MHSTTFHYRSSALEQDQEISQSFGSAWEEKQVSSVADGMLPLAIGQNSADVVLNVLGTLRISLWTKEKVHV